ncbi:hypothetical protein GW17_00033432 [Ensete ventricosum]|nr:hypothetical protein GW17_00033432 [Ensete ventricosum]
MMTKVHPNSAVPSPELPRLATCCYGADSSAAGRKESAAVLTVWRKSLLFSCNGFTVFDAEGNLAFRVDVYGSGTPEDLVLMDAAGKPLLTVRRKVHLRVAPFLSLGEKWLIYGGEDAVNPIYVVKRHVALLRSKATAAIARVAQCRGGGPGYEVEGSYSRRSCTVYDEGRLVAAEVRPKEAVGGVAFGGDVFRLVVHSDLNACLAMGILITLDQMFR